MTKIIKGDLILDKNIVTFDEDLKVEGSIISKDYRRNLIVNGNINVWNIDAGNIDAGNIDAWDINAKDINAGNIDAGNIDAENIDAWNIDAENIDAENIDAWNINAWDINAKDINAWDINAGNIDARDINYYAVCVAYKNIECNSIKGKRADCKHFVLDGKIGIKKETKNDR